MVIPLSAHRISDQKVRTVMIRVGDEVVRNAVGRKVGNHPRHIKILDQPE